VTPGAPAGGSPPRPAIAAHRGGARLWPENSLTAFRGALALGVDLVELDVHQTRDGEVVVVHDPTLERTTTGRGVVGDLAWPAVAAAVVRGTADERLPRLAEVLALLGPASAGLLLEIKNGPEGARYPGIEERVLALVGEAGLMARTTVMAFDWTIVARMRELARPLRRTALLAQEGAQRLGGLAAAASCARTLGADDLGIERTLLTPAATAAARATGLTIGVWTVNEPDELRGALAADVDYVTTDRPDLALRLRRAS
jgi:glycerophosphoryl diester phosphodiesterase